MAECTKCKAAIRGESGIRCSGVCNKIYHYTKKCAGVDNYSAKILDEDNFIRFMCDDCVQYIQNVDIVLSGIQDGVLKNKQQLQQYKDEFESSLKTNENEIKMLLEAIEKRYDERFKKIDRIQKLCEKNMQEVKDIYGNVNQIENRNKNIYETIEESNTKMCNEIKKIVKNTNINKKMSYAQIAATNVVMPDVSKNVPLIVKPKEKQSVEKTKAELNEKVDPINLKITNIENRKNGTLVIQSENVEERNKIKEAIETKISKNYEIKVPKESDMQIVITDMNFKMQKEELLEKLKRQNEILKDSNIELIKIYESKRYNRTVYKAKLRIDNVTYPKVISGLKLNVGWERCRVFDGTDVLQCFKCQRYNHKSSECKNEDICCKCHGHHKSKDCDKEVIEKCVNCMRENKRLNLGLDENHVTYSRECPVYKNKLLIKKRRMGLNI